MTDDMPIGIARWLIRSELERIEREAGPNVCRDLERAIEALIWDAIKRDRAERLAEAKISANV